MLTISVRFYRISERHTLGAIFGRDLRTAGPWPCIAG